jgi:hypothetical protein
MPVSIKHGNSYIINGFHVLTFPRRTLMKGECSKLVFSSITWAEIHQALLSHFSLLAEFLFEKVLVKDKDSKVLNLMNLNSGS